MRQPLSTRHKLSPFPPFSAREGGWGVGLPPVLPPVLPPLPFLPPSLPLLAVIIAIFAPILPLLPPSGEWQPRQTRLKCGIRAVHALEKNRKAAKTAMFTNPVNIAAWDEPGMHAEKRPAHIPSRPHAAPRARPSARAHGDMLHWSAARAAEPPAHRLHVSLALSPPQDKKGPPPCPMSPPPSRPTTTTSLATG